MAKEVTAQELLTYCNRAIFAILQGTAQEQWVGDKKYTALNIGELRSFRDALKAEISLESDSSGGFAIARFV